MGNFHAPQLMKIRSLLMIVVLSTLLPVLCLAIFLSIVFHHQQRSAFELRYLERVRAFGLVLDGGWYRDARRARLPTIAWKKT